MVFHLDQENSEVAARPANEGVTGTRSKPEAGAEMLPLLLLLRQEIDEARILAKVVEVGVALE